MTNLFICFANQVLNEKKYLNFIVLMETNVLFNVFLLICDKMNLNKFISKNYQNY